MHRNLILFVLFIAAAGIFMTAVLLPKPGRDASSQTTAKKSVATECEVDTDCLRVGCAGQLCLSQAAAAMAPTACEQQEQYRCYQLDNCICYNHTCRWTKSKEFMDCQAGLQL